MAKPGSSRSRAIARPTVDHLSVARAPSKQSNPSLPNATYITSSISGGTIYNVHGDFHNHNSRRFSPVASLNSANQSPPSLPPFNDAPIDRISTCFTGREPELDFITTSFNTFQSDKPTRFVIHGMPGLGKSQLALQHANLTFTSGIYSHIFWVSASTVEKLNQGLAQILGLLNHADRNHPDQAVQIAAVRIWLEQSDRHGCRRWLLVFDNVTAESAKFLRDHLPRQNAGGSILMTTRTRNIAKSVANVAGQKHLIFELKALSTAQSVSLLLKKAGIDGITPADLASAEKLVGRMGCLPLAVQQAGSYMKRSGLRNANQLQEIYDKRGLNEVIHWENDLNTYDETSILAAFTLQLQKLKEIDPDAHKLLKTLAFFDPENIPIDILSLGARSICDRLSRNAERSLIISPMSKRKVPAIRRLFEKLKGKQHGKYVPDISEETETNPLEGVPSELISLITFICSEERIQAAFRHFEDLAIAQPLYDVKPSLHIHDLIQWVLQQSTLIDQDEGYRALAIALLCNSFQTIDDPESPQSWDKCEIFVPHFTALGTQDETHSTISEEYLITNESIALYFESRGRYNEAETLLVRVLAHRRRLLGSKDIGTVNTMHHLAGVYADLGRDEEAESLYLPVLAAQEKQFGADHPSTLTAVHNLALIYKSQGKLDEAESLYGRALAGEEKQLGADHPSTLVTVNQLASLYQTQGKLYKAESLYVRALTGGEKRLGADHPRTLVTLNNLASLYHTQGKLDEAESLYARVLAGQEKQLGADHPSTLTTVCNLAGLYESQGKLDEAESLYARALAGQEKQLGADHPGTLVTVHNLAGLYKTQGKLDEAESLYARVLAGQEKQLGVDHPTTLTTVSNLAGLYESQGKLDEAESLYARALAGEEKQLGADHPSTLMTVHNFVYLRYQQGRQQEAEVLYRRALAGQEAKLGLDHPDTQTTLDNLADLLEARGRYQEAEVLRE
ncbi:TPR-like protein [Athelia psychrophila]|uniref:TPR-like protein n=1 Tax=Athelia psychrophila TaxID=1759441 RepID=A0A166KV48_9AGAM|nr:TPR-like protein [Fibularhizoctonia sp. CBS 109695]